MVYTNHVFPSENMRGRVTAPRVIVLRRAAGIINLKHFSVKNGIFGRHNAMFYVKLYVNLLTRRAEVRYGTGYTTKLRYITPLPADTILSSSTTAPPVGTCKLHMSLIYDVYYARVSSMVFSVL